LPNGIPLSKVSVFFIMLLLSSKLLLSEKNQRIYVFEDDDWFVKGSFNVAAEEDDEVFWTCDNKKYSLAILCVSFFFFH
jgi:hypothetical protein